MNSNTDTSKAAENEIVNNTPQDSGDSGSGLKLNKKTIFGICILLAVIMVFAGVLTQFVKRGEYYFYPDKTYILPTGEIVSYVDGDSEIEINGNEKITADEFYSNKCHNISEHTSVIEDEEGAADKHDEKNNRNAGSNIVRRKHQRGRSGDFPNGHLVINLMISAVDYSVADIFGFSVSFKTGAGIEMLN